MMQFNPCGMVLDYMKCCYELEVKPFNDSDETVGWRWYPAHPTAKPFPDWSFLTSRNWLSFHDESLELGEVSYEDRDERYIPPVPEAKGDHFCGPIEYFLDGQPFDEDVEPTIYNQHGIPACCLDPKAGIMGGEGTPAAVRTPPNYYRGSVSAEGRPASIRTANVSYQGEVGGEGRPVSLVSVNTHHLGEVSGEGTPAALVTANWLYFGSVGGEGRPATRTQLPIYALGRVGGEGTPAALRTAHVSYLGEVGGEGRPSSAGTPYSDPAQGGFMIGGESGDDYTPGTVVPGTSCATAYPIDLGTEYAWNYPTPGTSDWWQFNVPSLGTYHVAATGPDNVTRFIEFIVTENCEDIGIITPMSYGPPCWELLLDTGHNYYVVFSGYVGGDPYTFTVGAGPC